MYNVQYLVVGRSSRESVLSIATDARGTSIQGLTRRGVFPRKYVKRNCEKCLVEDTEQNQNVT